MSQYKGAATIRNAEGTFSLNGLATHTNSANNITWRDVTELYYGKDASNVTSQVAKDENVFELTFRFTPGMGDSFANPTAVKAAIASIRKHMQFIAGSFPDTDFVCADADKAAITDISKTIGQGADLSVDLTIQKRTKTDGTVINLVGSWNNF